MTIGELREFLHEQEEKWDSEIEHYFGKFNDQTVLAEHWNRDAKYLGVGESQALPYWELGLVIKSKRNDQD